MSKRRPARRPDCPTPWKTSFDHHEPAEQRIAEINSTASHRTKTPQRAYPCDCGSWHLTSKG